MYAIIQIANDVKELVAFVDNHDDFLTYAKKNIITSNGSDYTFISNTNYDDFKKNSILKNGKYLLMNNNVILFVEKFYEISKGYIYNSTYENFKIIVHWELIISKISDPYVCNNTKYSSELLKELVDKQLNNIPENWKLDVDDMKRICECISSSIFDKNECCVWNGDMTNTHKNAHINFYFQNKKVSLHRLLYINYVGSLESDEYLKFNCINKDECCNVNHCTVKQDNDNNDDNDDINDNNDDNDDINDNNDDNDDINDNNDDNDDNNNNDNDNNDDNDDNNDNNNNNDDNGYNSKQEDKNEDNKVQIKELIIKDICDFPQIYIIGKRKSGALQVSYDILDLYSDKYENFIENSTVISPYDTVLNNYLIKYPNIQVDTSFKFNMVNGDVNISDELKPGAIILYAPEYSKLKSGDYLNLLMNSRHYKKVLILVTSFPAPLCPSIRCNFDYILASYTSCEHDNIKIYENYCGLFENITLFKHFYKNVTTNDAFMVIDNRCPSIDISKKIYWYKPTNKIINKIIRTEASAINESTLSSQIINYQIRKLNITNIRSNSSILVIGKNKINNVSIMGDIINQFSNDFLENSTFIVNSMYDCDDFTEKYPNIKTIYSKDLISDNKLITDSVAVILHENILFNNGNTILKHIFDYYNNEKMIISIINAPLGLNPELRSRFDYVFIANDDSIMNTKRIYEQYCNTFPSFNIFRQVYTNITQDSTYMVVDNRTKNNDICNKIYWYK
jgi:hypothetical protein